MPDPLRVDKTPYDNFLEILLTFIGSLVPRNRALMAKLWDGWRSFNGEQLLNAVYSANRKNPDTGEDYSPRLAADASEVIAWKCEGGKRPAWLHSIQESELNQLST